MAKDIVADEEYYDLDGQLLEIKRQLRQHNGYPYDPLELKFYLQDAIEGKFYRTQKNYPLVVDYSVSIEKMVKRGGYDCNHINKHINSEHFPTQKTGKKAVRVEFIHLNKFISTDAVLRELRKMVDYELADPHTLLALGEKYPRIQLQFPIVELDSYWSRNSCGGFICIHGIGYERGVNLHPFCSDWSEICRFVVVLR